jgi:Uncharacterised protein family (UPF0175)
VGTRLGTFCGKAITISIAIPQEIEQQIGTSGAELKRKAREAFLVELYREHTITQHQLGEALGLDNYETDGVLKRYGVGYDLTLDEFEQQRAFFRERRPK